MFGPFCITNIRFRHTRSKTENAPNDTRMTLTTKSTPYTLNTCPKAQILIRLALRPAGIFLDSMLLKIRKGPNDLRLTLIS